MPDIKAQNETALASVKAIYDAADEANTLLDGMQTAATQAGTTLNGIYATAVQAEESATSAQASADSASEYASRALGNLASVQSVTETLNWITAHGTMTLTSDTALDPSHVYFVVDANGDYVVGGTHYSVVSEPVLADIGTYYELSINESLNNYVATHLVVDTEGLWIIPDSGGNKVLIATGSGSTYTTAGTYIVGASGTLASFMATGAQIGQNVSGQSRAVISEDGMQIYRNANGTDTQIVNLGYGLGNAQSGTSEAPYYTLGVRNDATNEYDPSSTYNIGDCVLYGGVKYVCVVRITTAEAWNSTHWRRIIGNYSVAEGENVTACGGCSHAEGYNTVASGFDAHAEGQGSKALGLYSHAEGRSTSASGESSHAEGNWTIASGSASHAEGDTTVASGTASHAQNWATIAQRRYQTAIGAFNKADTGGTGETTDGDYLFIIGNGTAEYRRSNAFTVDWSGNVVASGSVDGTDITASGDITSENAYLQLDTTATSGTDKEIYDALVSLGWDADCIV